MRFGQPRSRSSSALVVLAIIQGCSGAWEPKAIDNVQAFQGKVDISLAGADCYTGSYSAVFTRTTKYDPPIPASIGLFGPNGGLWEFAGTASASDDAPCSGGHASATSAVFPSSIGTFFGDEYKLLLKRPANPNSIINDTVPSGFAWLLAEIPLTTAGTHFSGTAVLPDVGLTGSTLAPIELNATYDFWPVDQFHIDSMNLTDIDDTPLQYLSIDAHQYFSGDTHIHGTTTMTGVQGDRLNLPDGFSLRIRGPGVTLGALATGRIQDVLSPVFGTNGQLSVTTSEDMFLLTPMPTTLTSNEQVALFGEGITKSNMHHIFEGPTLPALVQYHGTNRYGLRDDDQGGDDWLKPTIIPVLNHFAARTLVGDLSNMNGGRFLPHNSHTSGHDVDLKLSDGTYSSGTAAVANQLVEMLNDPVYGRRITRVYVYFPILGPFWTALNGVTLADGRSATGQNGVFVNILGHDTHFHWTVQE